MTAEDLIARTAPVDEGRLVSRGWTLDGIFLLGMSIALSPARLAAQDVETP